MSRRTRIKVKTEKELAEEGLRRKAIDYALGRTPAVEREPSRTAAQLAIIDLRKQLSMSQQDLAVAMGATVRTVAAWETAAFPQGRVLQRLERFATKRKLLESAARFRHLMNEERFLESHRKFFLTREGLDWQRFIAMMWPFRNERVLAEDWADLMEHASRMLWKALDQTTMKNMSIEEAGELYFLGERLSGYANEARARNEQIEKRTPKS
jgi:DNA-binding transcriptional regulator YiaG